MNKPKPIMSEEVNDNPEPHQRQSIKGLFTFYLQQQEMQLSALQSRSFDKAKNHQRRIKSSIKIPSQNQHHDIRTEKAVKKKKSKKDASAQENIAKSKKKKKSKKKTQKGTAQFVIEEISKTVPIKEEEQEPAVRFLKKIKQRKITKSPALTTPIIPDPQKSTTEIQGNEKYKFNRLFYPKDSEVSQNIVDNLSQSDQKIQHVNKFLKFKQDKSRCAEDGNTEEEFFKRTSSDFKKSSNSRKRNYTHLAVSEASKPLLGNNVKQNFYSHKKLREIVKLAHQIGYKQQTEPISPPSEIKQTTSRNKSVKIQQHGEGSEPIKLPEIKNIRLSKQLKKVSELVAQELERYGSNKSKNSGQKRNKSKSREVQSKNLIQYNKKQKSALKKKLETEPQQCCVALIDLSKSTCRQPELNNNISTSWSSKKKLLFKKLGINI